MVDKIVKKLIFRGETVSVMESCTGGAFANAITNVVGASKVIQFAAVTYSSEYKARLGVNREIIKKYTDISKETARDMAFKITFFSECTYGIGITGKFVYYPGEDEMQMAKRSRIFVCIYNSKKNKYIDIVMKAPNKKRDKAKEYVVKKTLGFLLKEIENKY